MSEKQEESYNHVLKYTGIFGGVQGLNILVSLVRNKFVAMILGPSGMGLVSLFNSTVLFISQATNLGISFSAVRHVSELFDQGDEQRITHFIRVVRSWSLLTALLGMLVCILAGPKLSSSTFSWGDHTLHFMMLSPAIGMLAITGGESAILKGARQLRPLAIIQVGTILAALVISLPLYYFFGQTAIVPVIVLMALVTMLLTVRHSYRLYPLHLFGERGILGEGMEMVRLGVAFVLAAVFGSGSEMLIRAYLNVAGELDIVGLYNAGYMITMTYGGMVFSAMETDYFPRLSAIGNDARQRNEVINRQCEVTLLIIAPMLAALMVALPVIIPLLFSREFMPVVGMCHVTLLSMYFRAIYLPIGYISLARGDSWTYLVLEAISYICIVILVLVGFRWGGITGTGYGLALGNVLDVVVTASYASFRYGYRPSGSVINYFLIQFFLGLVIFLMTFVDNLVIYWVAGCLLTFVSFSVTLYILRQKSSLWNALVKKFRAKIGRE
ncbi:MAG: oligosaccharide flippase family protein [Prevotella sp.]|nr:oligosaccharide flippase family protein [Prevotella sp.]